MEYSPAANGWSSTHTSRLNLPTVAESAPGVQVRPQAGGSERWLRGLLNGRGGNLLPRTPQAAIQRLRAPVGSAGRSHRKYSCGASSETPTACANVNMNAIVSGRAAGLPLSAASAVAAPAAAGTNPSIRLGASRGQWTGDTVASSRNAVPTHMRAPAIKTALAARVVRTVTPTDAPERRPPRAPARHSAPPRAHQTAVRDAGTRRWPGPRARAGSPARARP